MTTPASFNTAFRVVTLAMRDAGLIADGQLPNSDQFANGVNRLNDMINLWQTQGLKLFLLEDLAVTMTAAQAAYTFGAAGTTVMAKPHRVEWAYLRDSSGGQVPLNPLAWEEYTRLGNQLIQGTPNSYFVDKQATLLRVLLWNIPDASAVAVYTLHVVLRKQATGFVSLNDATTFPQEWFIALRWGLADELVTGQPEAIVARCERKAIQYRTALEDWDVEDSPVYFWPTVNNWG